MARGKTVGNLRGICAQHLRKIISQLIDFVWFYEINPNTLNELRDNFSKMLCANDPQFWKDRSNSRYASLMKVSKATRLDPISCEKRDRRGWVILEYSRQMEMMN